MAIPICAFCCSQLPESKLQNYEGHSYCTKCLKVWKKLHSKFFVCELPKELETKTANLVKGLGNLFDFNFIADPLLTGEDVVFVRTDSRPSNLELVQMNAFYYGWLWANWGRAALLRELARK